MGRTHSARPSSSRSAAGAGTAADDARPFGRVPARVIDHVLRRLDALLE